jgi:aldose 1-epimerase
MHGLLAGADGWEVECHESAGDGGVLAARFDFAAQPLLLKAFPFPHEIGFEAALTGAELGITITVRPSGDAAVPISFGFHPYLRLPGVERLVWEVAIPVRERLVLDQRMLPTSFTLTVT